MTGLEYVLELKGLSKKEGAEICNVSPQVLNNWIKRGIPQKRINEVSEILNVPQEYLNEEATTSNKISIKQHLEQVSEKDEPKYTDIIPYVLEMVEKLLSDDQVIEISWNPSAVIDSAMISEEALAVFTDATVIMNDIKNEEDFNKLYTLRKFLSLLYIKDTSWETNVEDSRDEMWNDLFILLKKHKII
jgi:transcriptional regulator with XRE-family HTH domain